MTRYLTATEVIRQNEKYRHNFWKSAKGKQFLVILDDMKSVVYKKIIKRLLKLTPNNSP